MSEPFDAIWVAYNEENGKKKFTAFFSCCNLLYENELVSYPIALLAWKIRLVEDKISKLASACEIFKVRVAHKII